MTLTSMREALKGALFSRSARVLHDTAFRVGFTRKRVDGSVHFVPDFAKRRPACRAVLSGGLYEPGTHRLMAWLLERRRGSIVHAGAFFGDMLPSFSAAATSRVYAFEPVLESFVLAQTCISENGLENVLLFRAGLSERLEVGRIATLSPHGYHLGGASQVGGSGQSTPLVPIDLLNIDDLSVLQLDVEGHELSALRGAVKTIAGNRPVILLEDNENACGAFLDERSYRLAGRIPGLGVWVHQADLEAFSEDLEKDGAPTLSTVDGR